MRVLLISCYELGHQPFSLASPAAHLRAAGLSVECLDLAVEPLDAERVSAADVIAISVPMHTATRLGVRAARAIREIDEEAHICFYGLYAPLNADYLLRTCADSVIGGEFEGPLVEWLKRLEETGASGAERRGVPPGVRTVGSRSEPYLGRQRFRVPARDLLPPLDRYARLEDPDGSRRLVGYTEASRGCAHRCRHCPIPPVYEGRLRIVQQEVVLADIANLVGLGAEHITFGDPDFLNGVKHSLRIVRRMHERFPQVSFDYTAKVEHIREHREAVEELAGLGCAFVVSAAESLDDGILRRLRKGHTGADVAEAVEITRSVGVALRPSLVSFTPWTTLDSYLDVLEFVEERGLIYHVDPVQYAIRLLLPPGSWLLEAADLGPHLRELEQENFAHRWEHPDPRLDRLHREVTAIVEAAGASGEDAAETFYRIRERAYRAANRRPPPRRWTGSRAPPRAPRLTESWFCCAEPTADQCTAVTERAVAF